MAEVIPFCATAVYGAVLKSAVKAGGQPKVYSETCNGNPSRIQGRDGSLRDSPEILLSLKAYRRRTFQVIELAYSMSQSGG